MSRLYRKSKFSPGPSQILPQEIGFNAERKQAWLDTGGSII